MPTLMQPDMKKWLRNQKKTNKKQIKKDNTRQKKQQQSKKRDYRREKTYTLLTNNENDRELKENINLSIRKESDVTSEGENNNNNIERQISENAQMC
jgi:hypothetical protein